ncbi:autophagy related lipase [Grosmannia clavigera kw1407]|uniref:triacylglycerol lipase n=1 Tax=Grosmannia clavigera (strain kw1407 / UAMH 11150) TaxID=655863 RepID=F0XUF6_GROCL|nr:autophagy related lipase [Grosmannia clavigera kw1407]EFW98973.1 autophagy related lipase [Grosmannia clavigera kw1407]
MAPHRFASHPDSRGRCRSAGRVTAKVLLSFLAISAVPLSSAVATDKASEQLVLPLPPSGPILSPEPPAPADHVFTLRHIYHHGTHQYPKLHRKMDVHQRDAEVWLDAADGYARERLPTLRAKSHASSIERLVDRRPSVVDPMVAMARERGYVAVLSPDAWTVDSVSSPNITDKDTVLNMAYMASNAYVETPDLADWFDVGNPYNRSGDFGWEGDGLRGHVFADETNSTIVIGLKGTSLAVFDGEGTTTNDKENDNLFFSCCCGQQGQWTYRQVCNCATGTYACNNTCVRQALHDENRYYMAARELYTNITQLYPGSNVWLTGHSLGGALSSFLGLTYGHPAVTFQAVPEALAASRLGLPVPPGADPNRPQSRQHTGTFHVGHTADPIYIGTCNGATATCSYAGYALETACHTGYECVYDVVADLGWRVGVGTHKIHTVINDVLRKYDSVPQCKFTPECRDCAGWKIFESNGTERTTTSATSSSTTSQTRTRTETCKTPGWWGCLDETTTTGASTATTATTATTTTTSIEATTTDEATTTTATTTCKTPGRFWGCKDDPTPPATSTTTTTTTTPHATTTATETSCATPGRFWGCLDPPAATNATTGVLTATSTQLAPTHAITAPPAGALPTQSPPVKPKHRCLRRSWLGFCKDWENLDEL